MSESTEPRRGVEAAEPATGRECLAAVLFTDGRGRVPLCEPLRKPGWEAPGRAVGAAESPRMAAARAADEILGLEVEPGRLLAVDWVPPMHGRTAGVVCVFDGGRLESVQAESIRLPAAEFGDWRWCTVAEAHERMRPMAARRIEAALKAIGTGETAYLEAGFELGGSTG